MLGVFRCVVLVYLFVCGRDMLLDTDFFYCFFFFFFNDTATTEIYTLSLHDALPISYLEMGGSIGFLFRN